MNPSLGNQSASEPWKQFFLQLMPIQIASIYTCLHASSDEMVEDIKKEHGMKNKAKMLKKFFCDKWSQNHYMLRNLTAA